MTKDQILKTIFMETTNGQGQSRRYVAKAFNNQGHGWGVYDRIKGEYLPDDIAELNEDNFRESIN